MSAERNVDEIVQKFWERFTSEPTFSFMSEMKAVLTTERTARVSAEADDAMHQEVLGERINSLIEDNKELKAKLLEVEKELICSECGGTDSVCAKAWLKQRDELQARLSLALKVVEATRNVGMNGVGIIELNEALASFDQTGGSG